MLEIITLCGLFVVFVTQLELITHLEIATRNVA